MLDVNCFESEIVLYKNKDASYEKNIYLQRRKNGLNVIDSIRSYCGKFDFCNHDCLSRIC